MRPQWTEMSGADVRGILFFVMLSLGYGARNYWREGVGNLSRVMSQITVFILKLVLQCDNWNPARAGGRWRSQRQDDTHGLCEVREQVSKDLIIQEHWKYPPPVDTDLGIPWIPGLRFAQEPAQVLVSTLELSSPGMNSLKSGLQL